MADAEVNTVPLLFRNSNKYEETIHNLIIKCRLAKGFIKLFRYSH